MKSTYRRLLNYAGAAAASLTALSTTSTAGVGTKLQWVATDLLCKLYQAMKNIVGVIAVLVIVGAGFRWVMSQNDPGQRNMAKEVIKSVLIGLAVVVLANAVIVALMGGSVTGC